IEFKAYLNNISKQKNIIIELAGKVREVLYQEDTFFKNPKKRLKLRKFPDKPAELISYDRDNTSGPKKCDYRIYRTNSTNELEETLTHAYGVRGKVIKKRELYMLGRTRIHLDEVKDLGNFIEIEVVLEEGEEEVKGVHTANELLKKLHIEDSDLIDCAYIDLLGNNKSSY
ncbi:UNVERIFIED_CONTAM: hypothetical protein GTU68_049549, partial [Idotea baltica]|nr:hypothetical protein [Idotea baltica]